VAEPAYCSIPEVAGLLGVSKRTVEAFIAAGELRAICVSRNRNSRKPRLRIAAEELERFTRSRSTAPPPAPSRRARRAVEIPQYV
jgi:excisionase family DNA binding protein